MKTIKCKCGYSWLTNSNLKLVTCPSCGHKVQINQDNLEDKKDVTA